MKSLTLLWNTLADELGRWCHVSTHRDCKTVAERSKCEGVSFLTITLPTLGKDLQKALDQEKVTSDLFPCFRKRGKLPIFMGGFLDLIFDRRSGDLLDNPSIDSIFAVRQLSLFFQKISLECSKERVESAMQRYVETDVEVARTDACTPEDLREGFRRMSVLLWSDVFADVDNHIHAGDIFPRHGSGATADRIRGNAKYDLARWTWRLEAIFPFGEFALPSLGRGNFHLLDRVQFDEPGTELPVKVVDVPKTLETPRIIAEEPAHMQYMQQALLGMLVPRLEGLITLRGGGHARMRHFIGFHDQAPNRELAWKGSLDQELATLDLKEASDRVSNQHVLDLTARFPWLCQALQATRSTKADVPGYGTIPLAKFASMGSAVCFPVEAMVFLTIIFLAIEQQLGRPLSRADVKSYRGRVRVYGDDIVVPVDHVQGVIGMLESFGFLVNTGKSYWNGKFRESCGGDYYDGVDVTPTRVRRVFPTSHRDAEEMISLVSLRNQLYKAGLWRTAKFLDETIERVLPHFPVVEESSSALGRHSVFSWKAETADPDTQTPLVKAFVASANPPPSEATGLGALMKCLLINDGTATADDEHLLRSGRPLAVRIKPKYVTPY